MNGTANICGICGLTISYQQYYQGYQGQLCRYAHGHQQGGMNQMSVPTYIIQLDEKLNQILEILTGRKP